MRELESRDTYACGTVRINRRDFPADLKREKLVRGEIRTRQCGNLVATMWKDKRVESLLSTNTPPEAEIHAEQQIVRGRRKRVVPADSIGSLRIDDFFHDDDVGIAESPTTHVQKDVAQEWASSRGRWRRQTECFEVVLTVWRLRFVVTFFCAILRPLSLGYHFKYLRKNLRWIFASWSPRFPFFLTVRDTRNGKRGFTRRGYGNNYKVMKTCLLYTSPSPRDA